MNDIEPGSNTARYQTNNRDSLNGEVERSRGL